MDANLLKNLGLDSSINQNDLQMLNQLLTSFGGLDGKNKQPKMTAKERNNLISKLSSNTTLNEIPKKELKDMNEQEKEQYRNELRQRLKNKQNEQKMLRTNNVIKKNTQNNSNYSDAIVKITEMMKQINQPDLNPNLVQQPNENAQTIETTQTTQTNQTIETNQTIQTAQTAQTNLTNIKQEIAINKVINQANDVSDNNLDDNLDDYLN
jgi:hypothetical protein